MFRRLVLICIGIAALSYLSVGCGVRPQVDFYVNPVAVGEEQEIDEEASSVIAEEAGISVTVSAMDAADLLEVASDARINPYVYVTDWGIARPLYTVFGVVIKNNRESKVLADLSGAVLMDEQGEQYDAVPYEVFRERYEAYPRFEREVVYYPYSHYRPPYYRRGGWRPWYYHYDRYWGYRPLQGYGGFSPYYVRRIYDTAYLRRAVAKGTLLRPVKLYPGGKRQGFLVFPALSPDAGELKLIIPGITIYRGDEERNIEFQFHFERIPAVKD